MRILNKERAHLTALDRRAIAAMRAKGWTRGETKRRRYRLEAAEEPAGAVRCTIDRLERDDWGRPVTRRTVAILAF